MVDERLAFLRAVCDDPEDDTPRLVFADWLDEHDEGDYAAFIRVQVAIAERRRDCGCGACRKGGQHHNGPCAVDARDDDGRRLNLRRTEYELWDSVWRDVTRPVRDLFGLGDDADNVVKTQVGVWNGATGIDAVGLCPCRGFVEYVKCAPSRWLDAAPALVWPGGDPTVWCPGCLGHGEYYEALSFVIPCQRCGGVPQGNKGSGRVRLEFLPTMVPVKEVDLTVPPVPGWHRGGWSGDARTGFVFARWPRVTFKVPLHLDWAPSDRRRGGG